MLLFLWFKYAGPVSREGLRRRPVRAVVRTIRALARKADAQFNSITGGRDLLVRNMTIWIAAVYCARVVAEAVKVAAR